MGVAGGIRGHSVAHPGGGGPGSGTAELGWGEGLTKSQLGIPLFLIRVRVTPLKFVEL